MTSHDHVATYFAGGEWHCHCGVTVKGGLTEGIKFNLIETRMAEARANALRKAMDLQWNRLLYEDGRDKHIGPRGLCPGVQVVLVDRVAAIVDMLPFWNVRVRLFDGSLETWWRGNLQLVLPREPLPHVAPC